MKRYIKSSQRVREKMLEDQGFEFKSYEYDYDAQTEAKKYEKQGYEVKLLREQTDTPGLKMYSIWIRN